MSNGGFIFPENFLWGAAGSGHQIEGNNNNSDWFALEQGFGQFKMMDMVPHGDACDSYHRFEEDIKILSELGYNSYRFSVEWSRIEPVKGRYSMAELDHYKRVAETCHKYGIKPVLTYHHFSSPRWMITDYGWSHKDTPKMFGDYCAKVTSHMGDLLSYACTINEANIYSVMPYVLPYMSKIGMSLLSSVAPFAMKKALGGRPKRFRTFLMVPDFEAIINAHKTAKKAIKAEKSNLPVGWTLSLCPLLPEDGADEKVNKIKRELYERYYDVSNEDDFLGVQVYSRIILNSKGKEVKPSGDVETDATGKLFDPESLEIALREIAKIVNVPLLVTENGINTEDDTQRERYIHRAVKGMANSINDGINVIGYLHWSIMDNYEWGSYSHKYGLISVNNKTFERTIKPSAKLLGQIAKSNGI